MPRVNYVHRQNIYWYDTVFVEDHKVYRMFGAERVGNLLLTNIDGNIGQTGSDESLVILGLEGYILTGAQEAIRNFGAQITIGDMPQGPIIPLGKLWDLRLKIPQRQRWEVDVQPIVSKFNPSPIRLLLNVIRSNHVGMDA